MAIPENQLEKWSHQGSITQSAQTYNMIKGVLDDANAPYHSRAYSIFLQGSYGNDTNIYNDSDVDIVIKLDQTYYSDIDNLTEAAKTNFDRIPSATYSWKDFKLHVLSWLQKQFGASVVPGKKAIFVKGSGNRRDADVLVCANLRRWSKSSNGNDGNYAEGICFFLPDGKRIDNFPKQHAENCAAKHQETNQWFKPVVRVYKNMRNRMVEDGVIKDGIAPSYFLEGMLWNVPKEKFGKNFDSSFVSTFNWIVRDADRNKLLCANKMFYLVRDNAQECWPTANCNAYLAAAKNYWEKWA